MLRCTVDLFVRDASYRSRFFTSLLQPTQNTTNISNISNNDYSMLYCIMMIYADMEGLVLLKERGKMDYGYKNRLVPHEEVGGRNFKNDSRA